MFAGKKSAQIREILISESAWEEMTCLFAPSKASLPSQQETLGQIVMDILNEGRHLNRKALCTKLLSRLDRARAPEEESHYQTLIGLLFAGQE
ncbi:hypothetical protein SL55_00874 [Klebsiella pneumoniae]|nr:hypothetical protein SL55_00874 [Klebsiella pneumoniae]